MYVRLKHLGIGLGLVLLLTFLFVKTTGINSDEHNRYSHDLRRLKELHATLDKRLLESRYGLLTTYDHVNRDLGHILQLQAELAQFPAFLRTTEKVELQKLLQEHAGLLDLEGKTLERFKSQNAILNNSLRYFPSATAKILAAQAEHRLPSAASANLTNILQDVLIYYLLGHQVSAETINEQIQTLIETQAQKAKLPPQGDLRILLSHARVILRLKPEIDRILSESVAYPTPELVEKISNQYEAYYQQAERQANFYRLLLFGFSILLLVYIAYIIVQLKQATLALHATNETLEQRVQGRTAELTTANHELAQSEANHRALIHAIPDSLLRLDKEGSCLDFIPDPSLDLPLPALDWKGRSIAEVLPPDVASQVMLHAKHSLENNQPQVFEFQLSHCEPLRHYESRVVICGESDILTIMRDISEQKNLEEQLLRAQKLESIGQLAAGIAHEINTPTQYVGDNTRFLQDSFQDLYAVLEKNEQLVKACRGNTLTTELLTEMETAIDQADIEYLSDEIPKAIEQALNGVERISKIVQSMKEFAHPGSAEKKATNLNHAIDSTITVASNEWKYIANLETDFAPDLPPVLCLVGEFNQVMLNLIINATHAIADVVGDNSQTKGTIKISTRHSGDWAEVRITDSGTGIPEAVRSKIFDPFFTTKEVGKGTGQGLAISYAVIVEKHSGQLTFETESGRGTTFIIRLPLAPASSANQIETTAQAAG